jgi:hypothetical protein
MADPLDQLQDNKQRLQLLWLRLHYGQTLRSEELREQVNGFKTQMGIYKPSGSRHALWVRETLHGPYPDEEPKPVGDGSWTYRYSPEGRGGKPDMDLATNQALLRCMDDGVPIGVLRQRPAISGKASYQVLGLAFVEGFDGKHFHLRSEPIIVENAPSKEEHIPFVAFEEKRVAESVRLVRDSRFGVAVRLAYRDRCAACQIGFTIRGASIGLEAAHIIPANKKGTSLDVRNGLLLCANHHALLDGYGWTLDEDLRVLIAKDRDFRRSAEPNHIMKLEGRRLPNLPEAEAVWPAPAAVEFRLKEFEAYWNLKS